MALFRSLAFRAFIFWSLGQLDDTPIALLARRGNAPKVCFDAFS
jgi:hypothetical protein